MKKQSSLAEFFKSKSFYALLCVGALAIIAMSLVGLNQPSNRGDNNLVDLNEPNGVELEYLQGEDDIDLALDSNNPTSEDIANIPSDNSNEVARSDEDGFYIGETLPSDVYENDSLIAGVEDPIDVATEVPVDTTEVVTQPETVAEPARPVMKLESLYFDDESMLSWPVMGDIVVSYNKKFENETKRLWESLEAVCISANDGDTVRAAANGIVKEVVEVNGQLGTTVTVSLGNGYELTYGQLKDVKVKSGEYVEVGQSIASVAEVSNFYASENNHLYLSLSRLEGDATVTVDPMLYLSSTEE